MASQQGELPTNASQQMASSDDTIDGETFEQTIARLRDLANNPPPGSQLGMLEESRWSGGFRPNQRRRPGKRFAVPTHLALSLQARGRGED